MDTPVLSLSEAVAGIKHQIVDAAPYKPYIVKIVDAIYYIW
jgi:hypothetical protein